MLTYLHAVWRWGAPFVASLTKQLAVNPDMPWADQWRDSRAAGAKHIGVRMGAMSGDGV